MNKRIYLFIALSVFIISISAFINKREQIVVSTDLFIVDTLAKDLTVPWAIAFLPDKTMLFTERSGNVRIYRNGKLVSKPIKIAEVNPERKMGLLGLAIHPDFVRNHLIYISYNYKVDGRAMLRIMRYRFINDTLFQPKLIIENINASANHTGCRIKFGPDKKLYITTGDADRPINAQDLKSLSGKILRLNDNGSIPIDNPFDTKNDTARKEIWTYGHRNTQGLDFQPGTGYLFNSEHGPTGGDEVNQINRGLNYGWPVIHHRETREGMVSPILEYTPSIGPSELIFYNANTFPGLKGNLLLASLRGESITRLILDKNKIVGQEVLLKQQYGRLRALTVGPDGYIYFSTSQIDPPEGSQRPGYDMILRLRPSAIPIQPYRSSSASAETQITKVIKRTPAILYQQLCASCHGKNLEGTASAKALADNKWTYGSDRKDIIKNIRSGIIEKGMPSWEGALSQKEIEELATYVKTKKK